MKFPSYKSKKSINKFSDLTNANITSRNGVIKENTKLPLENGKDTIHIVPKSSKNGKVPRKWISSIAYFSAFYEVYPGKLDFLKNHKISRFYTMN